MLQTKNKVPKTVCNAIIVIFYPLKIVLLLIITLI